MRYRKGQQQVLAYNGGRMGVAAVPGAGKTTTLAALAAQLIQRGLPVGSRVLVVTYQNAGADNVQARIRGLLEDAGRPAVGFEVRTLHSLSYTILRENPGLVGLANPVEVLDSRTTTRLLDRAVSIWNNQNPDRWRPTLPDASKRAEELWTRVCRIVAQQTIRVAKGTRLTPEDLLRHLSASPAYDPSRLHVIGAEVYALYQQQVRTLGGLDYDDLVRLSVDLLTEHPDVAERLRKRWPFVLEDEAQDSVPLQEELLTTLTGEAGNWVRVGDPNQAIMSTFTAADPRYLTDFLAREDVAVRELDEAGRSAPVIMELANRLVDWVCTSHPVSSVREGAFRHQLIQPTGPGDPQPNPPAGQSKIEFFGFPTRKDQHVLIAERAVKFCRHYRTHTHAILVPTNDIGFQVAAMVRRNGGDLDEMLSTTAGSRQVAETLRAVLAFVVDPVDRRFIVEVVRHLFSLRIPELAEVKTQDAERAFRRLHTEQVLYPVPGMEPTFEDERLRHAVKYIADWLRRWLRAAQLPVDQLVLTVADDLFAESRLATAHRVANTLRTWADQNPSWRLSDLLRELDTSLKTKQLRLDDEETNFEPRPGVLTLTTMHRAKGLEWDFVHVVDVDGERFRYHPDDAFKGEYGFIGGNPAADVRAALASIAGLPVAPGETPTQAARQEAIAEDFRLLYVAITRARRYLSLSWGVEATRWGRVESVPRSVAFEYLRKQQT